MSRSFDVSGTDEEDRKGDTPKERFRRGSDPGHTINSRMTVIRKRMGSYQSFF